MLEKTLKLRGDDCVGIVGAGQLGSALAAALLTSGLPKSRLLLCHKGSSTTRSRLASLSLAQSVVDCSEVGRRCSIVIVALRPQDAEALSACSLRTDAVVVSCMAGVSINRLPIPSGINQSVRLMPSPPETIERKCGIAGVFPRGMSVARHICAALSLKPVYLSDEDAFHAFTALGVCLPAALSYWKSLGNFVDKGELLRLAAESKLRRYNRILKWAVSVSVADDSAEHPTPLFSSAATRGGVTQTILDAIRSGHSLSDGLRAGIRRSKELQNDRS